MSKSFKFKNNMYLDTKGIVHNKKMLNEILNSHFYGEQSTPGDNIQEFLRNRITYCDSLCTNINDSVISAGDWTRRNYGFSIYSRNGVSKHLVWINTEGIYFCRLLNGGYSYKKVSWSDL